MIWVCMGAGPSLTPADIETCRGRATVIVINSVYKLCPWADILYAADFKWWDWEKGAPSFQGRKYTASRGVSELYPDVTYLSPSGNYGYDSRLGHVRTGSHGGYQALHFALQHGASKVLLLGYDLQPSADGRLRAHADHPGGRHPCNDYNRMAYHTILPAAAALGVDVINCSRATSIQAFPRGDIGDELARG